MSETDKKCNAPQAVSCTGMPVKDSILSNDPQETEGKPGLLLHSCCGPCSTAVIERLVDEFDVTVFFYNPCITDEEEYRKRREAQISFIHQFNEENMGRSRIHLLEGDYCPGAFFEATEGLEKEPEGGARCTVCFRQRLEKAAETASIRGLDYFGTTLTVSPHKNALVINEIGMETAKTIENASVFWLPSDFKKKNGYQISIQLSRKYDLYRQDYCGCEFARK